ncbi:MAG: proton-conducting membrane transporter [Defluviitaleaceae bacterium]|nr:proton-conducting membrane transporter [Defluviitaleaceae bacterium]
MTNQYIENLLFYFVVSPVIIAVILYLSGANRFTRIVALLAQSTLFYFTLQNFLYVSHTNNVISSPVGGYYGFMGIVLVADMLSSMFIMLTAFIFLIATFYSFSANHSPLFWLLKFLWQASLIGIFLSGDFFNIFVLTEIATIVVTVLIMYERKNRNMYDGMIYLVISTIIVNFFVFGVGYLYRMTGTLDISLVSERVRYLYTSDLILPYALIMTFVGLKCALMPMYSWLPKAHGSKGAPSSVSAILSGLHIKSGLYLFLRFSDVFQNGGIDGSQIFLVLGIITALAGVIFAVSQTDIKLMLAYSTIAQVGLILVGLSIGDIDGYNYVGGLFHIANHAIFKACLFLGAGIISHYYHTRESTQIRGVFFEMPAISIAMILALLGIIGTPLFNGSISKYFLMSGTGWDTNIILNIVNLGTIIICIKFSAIFFGKKPNIRKKPLDIMSHGVILLLGVMCFLMGILGIQTINFLFGYSVYVNIAGYTEKAIIFFVSLMAGYVIYKAFLTKEGPAMKWIRTSEMGFRGMCFSMVAFFAFILIAVGFYN